MSIGRQLVAPVYITHAATSMAASDSIYRHTPEFLSIWSRSAAKRLTVRHIEQADAGPPNVSPTAVIVSKIWNGAWSCRLLWLLMLAHLRDAVDCIHRHPAACDLPGSGTWPPVFCWAHQAAGSSWRVESLASIHPSTTPSCHSCVCVVYVLQWLSTSLSVTWLFYHTLPDLYNKQTSFSKIHPISGYQGCVLSHSCCKMFFFVSDTVISLLSSVA